MHDFLLAKEIIDEVLKIAKERNLKKISRVDVKIGQVAMAHDGHDEHIEDISIENLQFGLEGISHNTILKNTKFNIEKIQGDYWKIVSLDGE
ncbi:MAG: hypothetical protein UR69_C0001G0237 [Candidatus Moranbacteria bacterium GW2011_GWE2_35_2-]|nr:MAG: hypothetical protein UR69_C0001G0237 [Candidatus Moranbacteria bacterium GW2011_GWE2_35_2-]KKQ22765.1 MAG: hypothetical protein US37_C0001G0037 [Candidatus Moranbacteria bacterium GW2011_GWF2_37_11]KKQ28919.1 MAG: hypothetical protein US44_C0005G0061 [Candidatus Moranbacteria bacterium GW2011_GWD1_37_17]KKQ31004.1 MAG: hypothetical protein US47_C0001G0237 [Candidatus Moranbacteria bacterium GW2011_GWE1_37_24]KKQ48065.1 MAG: hypothetical protein US66_C0002G0009 [Candidatus Moranbacteria 